MLRDEGIHPDEVVGVYMECGDDFAVAYLVALKTGGAFLLKLAYPVSVARGGQRRARIARHPRALRGAPYPEAGALLPGREDWEQAIGMAL